MLERSPTAYEAAKVLRAAGRPLHATAITRTMHRNGHKVALATVVSTLSRWVNSRSVFYRARPNLFGLITPNDRESHPDAASIPGCLLIWKDRPSSGLFGRCRSLDRH